MGTRSPSILIVDTSPNTCILGKMAEQHVVSPADVSNWKFPNSVKRDGILYDSQEAADAIDNIIAGEVPDFDVFLPSFPRSGSSILSEVCWQLLHGCDIDTVDTLPSILDRIAYTDTDVSKASWQALEPPILADTHLEFDKCEKLMERNVKVVVTIRNPKDTLVSFYNYVKSDYQFPGNWHQFMDLYRQGALPYGDFFDTVLSWWAQRDRENVLIVRYEDLYEKPVEVIKKISLFLGQNHDEEKLERLAKWAAPAAIGEWKSYLCEEDNATIDDLYERLCIPANLEFKFE